MFIETPWWRPEFYHRTNKDLCNDIYKTKEKIIEFKNNEMYNEYLNDYTEHHKLKYLQECIIAESNIKLTLNDIENIINPKGSINESNDKMYIKITNMLKCINKIFKNDIYIKYKYV